MSANQLRALIVVAIVGLSSFACGVATTLTYQAVQAAIHCECEEID